MPRLPCCGHPPFADLSPFPSPRPHFRVQRVADLSPFPRAPCGSVPSWHLSLVGAFLRNWPVPEIGCHRSHRSYRSHRSARAFCGPVTIDQHGPVPMHAPHCSVGFQPYSPGQPARPTGRMPRLPCWRHLPPTTPSHAPVPISFCPLTCAPVPRLGRLQQPQSATFASGHRSPLC